MTKRRTKAPRPDPPAAPPLRLEWIDPATLDDNPANWRTHPEAQTMALRDVIQEVGWAGALLYNERTKRLIDGHARKQEFAGKGPVPVLIGNWTDLQEKKILATLDPIAAMAGANKEALDKLIRQVQTGSEHVAKMLESLAKQNGIIPPAGAGGGADPGPQISRAAELQKKWKTASGQLWLIPSKSVADKAHRLLCGDSTNAEDVKRVMDDGRAGLMNTDPPYGVAYDVQDNYDAANATDGTKRKSKYAAIQNDELTGDKLQAFLEAAIRAAVPILVKNAAFYLWHPMLTQGTFFAAAAAAAAADILIHRQIIWVKSHFIFGRGDYHWKHELCFYGWVKGNRPSWRGERNQDTVWCFDNQGREKEHPSAKPVELFAIPIRNHLKPGEIAYEPFAGSGPQFVAAEQLGRLCFGLEIEPKYVAVILERLAGMGLKPERSA